MNYAIRMFIIVLSVFLFLQANAQTEIDTSLKNMVVICNVCWVFATKTQRLKVAQRKVRRKK
jgi:hypothetical protein